MSQPQVKARQLSVFSGSLTFGVMMEQIVKLAEAFPELDDNWFSILKERLKDRKFTDDRLIKAVNNTIDNFKYGKPNIAEIINYDEQLKMLRYKELQEKARKEGHLVFNDYTAVNVGGEKYFTPKEYVSIHRLKLWQPSLYMRRTEKNTATPRKKLDFVSIMAEINKDLKTNKTDKKSAGVTLPTEKYIGDYKKSPKYKKAKVEFEKELENGKHK